ncbi:Rrp15p-domain-containing protein, partial [Myriangium duriaei CBS 260.36]
APKRKRTVEHLHKAKKPVKRFKKQKNYHSSSESEAEDDDGTDFAPISMEDSDDGIETTLIAPATTKVSDATKPDVDDRMSSGDEDSADDDNQNEEMLEAEDDELALDDEPALDDESFAADDSDASDSDASTQAGSKKRKRNDPSAFANSMSKILSSKLSVSKRADPVLSRSAAASTAQKEMADSRLEAKAKQKIRAEKKAALERGRVQDVLGLETEGVSAAEVQERERRLKKTAQRGVVKLFNAVRAAQVQADVAREQAKKEGVVGMAQREQRINEMSKQGFLDLIAKGGKKAA